MRIGQKKTALRKKKEHDERRLSIIRAAKEVFFEKGFMATTMDGIADGCQLAKGTLYLYFKSKEELYISLMAEGIALLRDQLNKVDGLSLRADMLLRELLRIYYSFYEKHRQYFRIMFLSSQPDLRERAPDELLKKCVNGGRECMQIVSGVIEKGIESGVFREVNSWAFANVLWSMVNGIMMLYEQDHFYRAEVLRLPLHEMLQEALDLALNGLCSDKIAQEQQDRE